MPNLNTGILGAITVKVAPTDIKQLVAEIWQNINLKLKLNRQINQTMETMAQALFKSWFVDFEPVRAKVAALETGEDPTLAAIRTISGKTDDQLAYWQTTDPDAYNQLYTTASLFPEALVESELGLVPEGWRYLPLTELLNTVSVTHKFSSEKIIFLNTSDVLDGRVLINNYVAVSGLPGQAKKSIRQNDILFSEIRPSNRRFAFIDFQADDYVVSTKLMVLRSKNILSPLHIYYFIKTDVVLEQLQRLAESRSGTFPQITFSELFAIKMLVANQGLNDAYTRVLEFTHEKISTNDKQNQTLANLRDTLLPKLLSGELSVSEVVAAKRQLELFA